MVGQRQGPQKAKIGIEVPQILERRIRKKKVGWVRASISKTSKRRLVDESQC